MPSSTFSAPPYLPPARPNRKVSPPPKSKLGRQLWLWKMWFATTFGLTVMETWEQILFLTIFGVLFALFFVGVFWYLPLHLIVMEKRAVYYLWGHEGEERHWWKWMGFKTAEKISAAFNEL